MNEKRQYILCLVKDRQRLIFDSFYKFKDEVLKHPSKDILYLAYRDGIDMDKIKAVSVYNTSLGEQVATKEEALDRILGSSVNKLLAHPSQE